MRKRASVPRERSAMLVMAMTALTAPSSPSTSAAPQDGGNREVAQVPVKEPKKVDDEGRAFREFLEAYRLEPGQILKRVPPPRPEGIRVWWKQKRPNFGNQPHEFGAMTFRWRDPDQLENWSMTTGDGYPLRSLLRYLEVNLHAADIEGDPKLLDTVITGDWVYRVGEAEDRTVHALESIIQRTLRLRIAMTFRQVDREVVVCADDITILPSRADRGTRSRSTASKSCRVVEAPGVEAANSPSFSNG